MNHLEREKLRKKLKTYELFGASKFQKVVFAVERIKFKVLKTVFPDFIRHYDNHCDRKKYKLLKKAKTEEERQDIKERVKFAKMAMRKEFYQEKNRNYHIDKNKPTEILPYLEWNKRIHRNGILKNMIALPIVTAGVFLGWTPLIPLLVLEGISLLINFECINIQNYSITRYRLVEDRLKRQEERQREESVKNYHEASQLIHDRIVEKEELPSFDDIINHIQSKEQLKQLKQLISREQSSRENNTIGGNQKCNQPLH